MPKASAPKAPWVEVCESPQTISIPGCVMPCSGPMMWTMPERGSSRPKRVMPNSWQFRTRASIWIFDIGSVIPEMAVGGWHAVVDRGEGQIRSANRPSVQPQRVEGLGGGDLVDQMEVRVEQVGFAFHRANQMLVPDLFEESLRCHDAQGYRRVGLWQILLMGRNGGVAVEREDHRNVAGDDPVERVGVWLR